MIDDPNPEQSSFLNSFFKGGIEEVILRIVTLIAFLAAIADFFGLLEKVPWLHDRLPTLTIILVVGFIFSFRKTKVKVENLSNMTGRLDVVEDNVERHLTKLENDLKEAITNTNADSCYYNFFLCPPITSYIKFKDGKLTEDSLAKSKRINSLAVGLKKSLEEHFGGKVYYGGEEFAKILLKKGTSYTESDFEEYITSIQSERIKALYSTNFFVAIAPFGMAEASRYPNSIFEGGIAAGRKIRSFYFVTDKDSLPFIITNGKLNHTIDVAEVNGLEKVTDVNDPQTTIESIKNKLVSSIRELI